MRTRTLVVAAGCALSAAAAQAQFLNSDFETGTLSDWTVANTPSGVGAPGAVDTVDIDGPGPLGLSLAALFRVGQSVSGTGQQGVELTQAMTLNGGQLYTFEFDWAALNSSATNNAEGGVFSLIVDGVALVTQAAGTTNNTIPHYGHISFGFTPPTTGNYIVGARITRPFLNPAANNLSQWVDNFRPAAAGGPTGACCLPNGACTVTTQTACGAQNGIYRGDNTTCPANCPQPPTGACCLTTGCTELTQAQCTAQNGTYRGDNVTCANANCPQPCPPITGAIGGPSQGWPSTHGTQTTRLFRDGVADTCALSAPGGAPIAGSFTYDAYDFINTSATQACVQVDINTACTGTNFIYAGAYIGGYNPATPSVNNVASCGSSPNPTASMSFVVPGNTRFQIVFAEVTAGAGCPNYTFQVSGGNFDCNTTACYPDCNQDHALNVNDFICFQSAFAAGAPSADCDHNSALNVNDFICFQSAFAAGCSQL